MIRSIGFEEEFSKLRKVGSNHDVEL